MLKIQVLGPLGADIGGTPVHLGSPRQRAVIALLLAQGGRVVSVDRLIDRLWRGRSPEKATASLHVYVSNLRRALEPDRVPRTPAGVLVSIPPGYALRLPADAVDAWRFEAAVVRARTAPPVEARRLLEEALSWWRGAPFGEWADEEWAAAEAARLAELHLAAREAAVASTLATGSPREAVPAAEALVLERPLREEGWRLLVLALWGSGRHAEAVAQLRRASAVMAEEIGLGLGDALTELERALLAGRTEVLRAAVPEVPAGSLAWVTRSGSVGTGLSASTVPVPDPMLPHHEAATVLDPSDTELFVGRDDELRALDKVARDARRGGGVVLVTGEPGAGKSALLGRFRRRLQEQGWTVVVGRCPEFDGAPAAWAWVEALGTLARRTPPSDSDALAALLQEAGFGREEDKDVRGFPGVDGGVSGGRFRLHRAFSAWLREAAAQAPLAVVLDDLHRADSETLALLERTAGLAGSPVLAIAAYRPGDAADRLTETLAELALRSPYRLSLGGLPLQDVDTLVKTVCGAPVAPATVSALAERTAGNPFYVWESARLLASEGALVAMSEVPQGVRDVLRRRLRQLPAQVSAVLQLASVVGRETEIEVLVEAADPAQYTEPAVLDAVEAGVEAGLLTEPAPGVVRFAHALVRDTLYTDVGVRRARLHARFAEVLRRRRPHDLAALAHHHARAASTQTAALAVEYSLGAADLAERRYAHDTAVELLTQAIQSFALIPADAHDGGAEGRAGRLVALLGRLLRAEIRAGMIVRARSTRHRAMEAAEDVGHDALAAAALGAWIGPGLALSGPWGLVDPAALDAFVERLVARAERDPLVLSAFAAMGSDRGTDGRDLQGADRRDLLEALVAAGPQDEAYGSSGRAGRGAEVARRLAVARAVGDPLLLACALTVASAVMPDEVTDRRKALAAELRVLGYAHDLPANSWVREHIGALAAGAGNDSAGVRRHTEEGLVLAGRHRLVESEAINLSALSMLAHVEGRFDESVAGYEEVRERLRSHGSPFGDFVHALGVTTVRLGQGRPREAEPLLRSLSPEPGSVTELALGVVLARLGEGEQAHALGRHAPTAVPVAPDYLYGVVLSLRAELAFLLGDKTTAAKLVPLLLPLRDQLAGAAGISFATRPIAHSLGESYRLLGDEDEAQRQFALAEDVARQWRSGHLVSAVRAAAHDRALRR